MSRPLTTKETSQRERDKRAANGLKEMRNVTVPKTSGKAEKAKIQAYADSIHKTKVSDMKIGDITTKQDLIEAIRRVTDDMEMVGVAMGYLVGFDDVSVGHGREMMAASIIAKEWADGLDKQYRIGGFGTTGK